MLPVGSTLSAPTALRLSAVAIGACGLALGANTALYCAKTGCRSGVPFSSHIMVSEHKAIAGLESTLIVALTMLIAVAATLQHATR
jgi:hypothetical protein